MPVVRSEAIQEYEVGGVRTAGLATASSGAGEIALWRRRIEPRAVLQPAAHDHEHVALVLRGSGVLRENSNEEFFFAGDVLLVRAGTAYELVLTDDGVPLEAIMAMPLLTRHFTAHGTEIRPPWAN